VECWGSAMRPNCAPRPRGRDPWSAAFPRPRDEGDLSRRDPVNVAWQFIARNAGIWGSVP